MKFDADELRAAAEELESVAPAGVLNEREIEAQFRVQTALRRLLMCIPNDRIKPEQYSVYLRRVLGHAPSPAVLDIVRKHKREARPDEEAYVELEKKQNGRCALCGTSLVREAEPHVDHILPVAYGGKSISDNYQILCSKCNQGKKAAVHWVMASPYFVERDQINISLKMRYAVLARYKGRCAHIDCEASSRNAEIRVAQIISLQEGGRLIFDNLEALCKFHAEERIKQLQLAARAAVSGPLSRRASRFAFR